MVKVVTFLIDNGHRPSILEIPTLDDSVPWNSSRVIECVKEDWARRLGTIPSDVEVTIHCGLDHKALTPSLPVSKLKLFGGIYMVSQKAASLAGGEAAKDNAVRAENARLRQLVESLRTEARNLRQDNVRLSNLLAESLDDVSSPADKRKGAGGNGKQGSSKQGNGKQESKSKGKETAANAKTTSSSSSSSSGDQGGGDKKKGQDTDDDKERPKRGSREGPIAPAGSAAASASTSVANSSSSSSSSSSSVTSTGVSRPSLSPHPMQRMSTHRLTTTTTTTAGGGAATAGAAAGAQQPHQQQRVTMSRTYIPAGSSPPPRGAILPPRMSVSPSAAVVHHTARVSPVRVSYKSAVLKGVPVQASSTAAVAATSRGPSPGHQQGQQHVRGRMSLSPQQGSGWTEVRRK